jgi:cytochrome c oxidase subunit 2
MSDAGKLVYEQQGCGNCHDADGTNRGPTLAGIYRSQVKLKNGQSAIADEAYLRKAIMTPTEEIADTYQQIMPSYNDQITEEQLLQVIEYIKSLSGRKAGEGAPSGPPGPGAGRPVSSASGNRP